MSVKPDTDASYPSSTTVQTLATAQALVDHLAANQRTPAQAFVHDRLRDSVVRPLASLSDTAPSGQATESKLASASLDQSVWDLARHLSEECAAPNTSGALVEAAAAATDLALHGPQLDPGTDIAQRRTVLFQIVQHAEQRITVANNGPCLATNVEHVEDWLGQPLLLSPVIALCRCGASRLKPLCDGSHATTGFTDAKDPERTPDRRDTYPGVSLQVLDNRGLCAHSGFCTDRLSTVFHAQGEPFVTPSGGRMDEIIRAVRECPSGALSFAVDGRKAREEVDRTDRGPAVVVSRDGPYRVTGTIRLLDVDGADLQRNQGGSVEHYSLCRCGQSRNKPFCSGRHWDVRFRDPVPDSDKTPTLFEWAGGVPALQRLTRRFYETHVPADPLLAPLFGQMTPDHPERVAAWLAEVFGGPKHYTDAYGGYPHMVSEHMGAHLNEAQRARFVELLCLSADEVGLPADAEFRAAFVAYLEWGSRIAVENSQPDAAPPQNLPVPRWWWVCDATPGSRVSAQPQAETAAAPPAPLPGPDEPVRYEGHIKPLFRAVDRQSMQFAFDLWSHTDVAKHAAAILARLEAGTMPCDGAWSSDRLATFRRWVEAGAPA